MWKNCSQLAVQIIFYQILLKIDQFLLKNYQFLQNAFFIFFVVRWL